MNTFMHESFEDSTNPEGNYSRTYKTVDGEVSNRRVVNQSPIPLPTVVCVVCSVFCSFVLVWSLLNVSTKAETQNAFGRSSGYQPHQSSNGRSQEDGSERLGLVSSGRRCDRCGGRVQLNKGEDRDYSTFDADQIGSNVGRETSLPPAGEWN